MGDCDSNHQSQILLLLLHPLEEIAGLAFQLATEGVEGRESDRPGLVRFEDRHIGESHAEALSEIRQRDAAIHEQVIQPDPDGHGDQIVSDWSSSRPVPTRKTSAITRMIKPPTIVPTLRLKSFVNRTPSATKWDAT